MSSLLHEGVVECVGLLLSEERLGASLIRAFVLDNFADLRSLSETPRGLLVRFTKARFVRADRTIGLALTMSQRASDACLLGLALDPKALERLDPPPGAIVLAWHGAVEVHAPPFREVDPAVWIELDELPLVYTEPLGLEPQPPALVEPLARPLGAILGAKLPVRPTAEASAVVEAMQRLSAQRDASQVGSQGAAPAAGRSRLASTLVRSLATMLTFLQSLFRPKATPHAGAQGDAEKADALARPPGQPSLFQRLADRIDRWVRRQVALSRLSSWLFQKQAEYVANLLDAFDAGDLDEALRRAIPLAKEGGAGEGRVALGLPQPRADLTISARGLTPGGASFSFGGDLYAELRRRYKLAFERLEREGRIAEAAFVLADLLQDAEAAVAFLERHGLLREAAELAESRALAPGLIVRQWFRADDRARALRVARRRGGLLDAIARLERSGHTLEADALRLVYADHLAAAGDFAGAVEIAWKVRDARALVSSWVERARAQGGIGGARMLARQLAYELAPIAVMRGEVRDLAFEDGADGRGRRLAFASALVEHRRAAPSTSGDSLARLMARALYADAPTSFDKRLEGITTALVDLSRDAGLSADRPRWPALPFGRHYRHVIRAEDRGQLRVFDAVPLDRGRSVVALGEAGVALIDARGKTLAFFDQPVESLVVSDRGDRLLTVTPRGRVSKVGRIDLVSRRSEAFCEVELERYARTFDGSTWLATVSTADAQSDLVVIDVCDTQLSLLDRVAGLGATSIDVVRTADHVDVVSIVDGSYWACSYELPGLTLRGRWQLSLDEALHQRWLISTDSVYVGLIEKESDPSVHSEASVHIASRGKNELWRQIKLDLAGVRLDAPGHALSERFLALGLGVPAAGAFTVKVLRRKDLTSVGELVLEDTEQARLRLVGETLVLSDARGRIFAIDLESGEIVRNVRM